jgi:hypothetical protein
MAPFIIHSLWRILCMVTDWLSVVGGKSALVEPILDNITITCSITESLARQLRVLVDQCQSCAIQGHWEKIHEALVKSQVVDN